MLISVTSALHRAAGLAALIASWRAAGLSAKRRARQELALATSLFTTARAEVFGLSLSQMLGLQLLRVDGEVGWRGKEEGSREAGLSEERGKANGEHREEREQGNGVRSTIAKHEPRDAADTAVWSQASGWRWQVGLVMLKSVLSFYSAFIHNCLHTKPLKPSIKKASHVCNTQQAVLSQSKQHSRKARAALPKETQQPFSGSAQEALSHPPAAAEAQAEHEAFQPHVWLWRYCLKVCKVVFVLVPIYVAAQV